MDRYTLAIFDPDYWDTRCIIVYYCCYHNGPGIYPSESEWTVPGTFNLED